jgi:hypothetical protein
LITGFPKTPRLFFRVSFFRLAQSTVHRHQSYIHLLRHSRRDSYFFVTFPLDIHFAARQNPHRHHHQLPFRQSIQRLTMAPLFQFLSLVPTEHVTVAPVADDKVAAAAAIDIPIVQKTRRSSSTATEESTTSPRGSVDEAVVPAEVKSRFLKLGN